MRVRLLKALLWGLVGASLVALAARFGTGLGATTNLSDVTPWGLWIGLKLAGVAFAAGGFTIAAAVYVFQLERYHILARRAVLVGLLGYTFFVVSLIVDLGIPWNIWRPVLHWNLHSPLFEVAWCVMLYLTVLLLEFAPVVLERYRERWPPCDVAYRTLKRLTIPLVVFGIALSVLHQSSLGTLFAIMPHRQHPLFYSPIVNVLFFVSCVAMGLGAVIVESHVAHLLYRRRLSDELLQRLGRAMAWVVWLFVVVRFADLTIRGDAPFLLERSWNSVLFWVEMLLLLIVPSLLLQWRRVRCSRVLLATMAFTVVAGFMLNRVTVAGLAMISPTGTTYLPSGLELLISLGLVPGLAVLIWMFLVESYTVWEPEAALDSQDAAPPPPEPDRASGVWLGEGPLERFRQYSLVFVIAAALTFGLLPHEALFGASAVPAPVSRPRGREVLLVDGDRSGLAVVFEHQMHIDTLGRDDSCALCHHMALPLDQDTPCWHCHRDMWSPSDIFDHDAHARILASAGAEEPCGACHPVGVGKSVETSPVCAAEGCHVDRLALVQAGSRVRLEEPARPRHAAGYMDTMHELCVSCHRERAAELGRPRHGDCSTCHAAGSTGRPR